MNVVIGECAGVTVSENNNRMKAIRDRRSQATVCSDLRQRNFDK